MIVFTKYLLIPDQLLYRQIAVPLCFVSVGLAYLSYRYIETPFRTGSSLRHRKPLFAVTAAAIGLLALCGLAADRTTGFPQRLAADTRAIALGAVDTKLGHDRCDVVSATDILAGKACTVGNPGAVPTFAVFGDSFAEAVLPAIDAAAREKGEHGVSLVHGGCYPLVGVIGLDLNPSDAEACRLFLDASVKFINNTPSIRKIILSGRWTSAAEGTRFGADISKDWYIVDRFSTGKGYDENRAVFGRGVERTVAAFAGRDLYVVAYIPEQPFNVPQAEALCRYLGRPCPAGVARTDFDRRQAFVRKVLSTSAGSWPRYHVIDLGELLCSSSRCRAISGDIALYSDDNHLSRAGALSIQAAFDPIFAPGFSRHEARE